MGSFIEECIVVIYREELSVKGLKNRMVVWLEGSVAFL